VGEVVIDADNKGVEGIFMDVHGGLVFLRPERGGMEWTTRACALRKRPGPPRVLPVMQPSPKKLLRRSPPDGDLSAGTPALAP
jgi:hypothetical protein